MRANVDQSTVCWLDFGKRILILQSSRLPDLQQDSSLVHAPGHPPCTVKCSGNRAGKDIWCLMTTLILKMLIAINAR